MKIPPAACMSDSSRVQGLCCWLFVEGADPTALDQAGASDADVLIQELEDFTPPQLRPQARELCAGVLARWRARGKFACVRINPLDIEEETDGLADLAAAMAARPDGILIPKVVNAEQILRLEALIVEHETVLGMDVGTTFIIPNIESARGLMDTRAICECSPRVVACLVASEDMAADLGAERGRDGVELDYVRARFHLECTAAGVMSIDCPYTWQDLEGLEADTRHARRLGYRAKSAVRTDHATVINRLLNPSAEALARAERIVDAFEHAQAKGLGRVEVDGSMVERPIYQNARSLLARRQN